MELIRADLWGIVTIRAEADAEPFEGKVAVGKTIRNRMRFRYASNGTVAGTVLAPLQFSCWNAKDTPRRADWANIQMEDPLTAEAVRAWEASKTYDGIKGAVLYHNPKTAPNPQWKNKARFIVQIGNHAFYEDPILDSRKEQS